LNQIRRTGSADAQRPGLGSRLGINTGSLTKSPPPTRSPRPASLPARRSNIERPFALFSAVIHAALAHWHSSVGTSSFVIRHSSFVIRHSHAPSSVPLMKHPSHSLFSSASTIS
jgi:hypothetical protein